MKATEIRKGMVVRVEGELYRVMPCSTSPRETGAAWSRRACGACGAARTRRSRFRSEDEVEKVMLESKSMQYLYHDHHGYHFMDTETYDQVALADDVLGDTMSYILPESTVLMEWIEEKPVGVELPAAVDLKVVETAPGIKGATASAQRKPATLETGLVVQVPSFIDEGEVVRVSTQDGSYLERAK